MVFPKWISSALVAALAATIAHGTAVAGQGTLDARLSAEQRLAVGFGDAETGQARLTLQSDLRLRFARSWGARVGLRLETAGADTGLGSRDTYRDVSRPLEIGDATRLELDEALVYWRRGRTRLTLGKQTFAWGVLDGLQVTDRLDAVRRRDAVFTPQRPERIARWGGRLETRVRGTRIDLVTLFDGSGDELALRGDAYEITAPRLRAGLPANAPLPPLSVDTSGDATLGLRARRRIGGHDLTVLALRGPDPEPVIATDANGVLLAYPTRSLYGLNWQRGEGSRVWRAELAWIPDQPVNLAAPLPTTVRRKRWIAGLGLDWDLRGGVLVNAQFALDRVRGDDLVRPELDQIVTLRAQRAFANDTWRWSVELLGSLSDGDGTFRPAIAWQASDTLRLSAGVDVVWGTREGLFGQFRDTDRLWLNARWAW